MNITLDLDDSTLKKAIDKGIGLLTEDELKDIARQSLLKAFSDCKDFRDLLIKEGVSSYYGCNKTYELGPLASKMAEASIDGMEFSEIRDRMISELREHHRDILMDAMTKLLFSRLFENNDFNRALHDSMDFWFRNKCSDR